MLMPAKHITFSESILGLGSYVLKVLDKPKTIDTIWGQYQKDIEYNNVTFKHSFDNFMLAFVFLFSVDKLYENNGKLERKCD